jgi:uncharacterized repeat protein (TIGR03803 family)
MVFLGLSGRGNTMVVSKILFRFCIVSFALLAATARGQYALTTLVEFNSSNGANPQSGLLIDSSGNLFGKTLSDASGPFLEGTIFKVAAGTHALTTWSVPTKGGAVGLTGPLYTDAAGNFYGTTVQGGGTMASLGEVYVMLADTHTVTRIANFDGTNGSNPQGGVIADAAGNLYGTTEHGGPTNNGTVFEIAAGTSSATTILTFDGPNGRLPFSNLVADRDGNLYGTTASGGPNLRGTVFKITSDTHTDHIIFVWWQRRRPARWGLVG